MARRAEKPQTLAEAEYRPARTLARSCADCRFFRGNPGPAQTGRCSMFRSTVRRAYVCSQWVRR